MSFSCSGAGPSVSCFPGFGAGWFGGSSGARGSDTVSGVRTRPWLKGSIVASAAVSSLASAGLYLKSALPVFAGMLGLAVATVVPVAIAAIVVLAAATGFAAYGIWNWWSSADRGGSVRADETEAQTKESETRIGGADVQLSLAGERLAALGSHEDLERGFLNAERAKENVDWAWKTYLKNRSEEDMLLRGTGGSSLTWEGLSEDQREKAVDAARGSAASYSVALQADADFGVCREELVRRLRDAITGAWDATAFLRQAVEVRRRSIGLDNLGGAEGEKLRRDERELEQIKVDLQDAWESLTGPRNKRELVSRDVLARLKECRESLADMASPKIESDDPTLPEAEH